MKWFRLKRPDIAGPPPFVVGLLIVESVAVVAMLVIGIPWGRLLASAGPVVALTLALLNPTVQELGRRKPKLRLRVNGGDSSCEVRPRSRRPWPLDQERIVANELTEARHSVETLERAQSSLSTLALGYAFAVQPSKRDYERARASFEQEVRDYEAALRTWLEDYSASARRHSLMFELSVGVLNRRGGAHAEAVSLVLELPEGVTVADEWPTVGGFPERPTYVPPRPRQSWMLGSDQLAPWTPTLGTSGPIFRSAESLRELIVPTPSVWEERNAGRTLQVVFGDIHSEQTRSIEEPLLLVVDGEGRFELRWTLYSKSDRHPSRGVLTLTVSSAPSRPAFGRLAGVVSYPDVAILNDDAEVAHRVRTSDPPLNPPAPDHHGDDVLEILHQGAELADWRALGLDPDTDGPESVEIRMTRAKPRLSETAG